MSSLTPFEPPRTAAPFRALAPLRAPVYALVGNPNSGKSTLFNALTGLRQKVGNYPGVTVEKKLGTAYSQHGQAMTIIDLPGAYSLAARSPDEAVTRDVLFGRRPDTPAPDRIVCVVDAANLERNLYLVHQVLDLGRPVIVVLNMMDLARSQGFTVRAEALQQELGIPVIPCEAVNGRGILELKLAMSRSDLPLSRHAWDVPAELAPAVASLQAELIEQGRAPLTARAEALLVLTEGTEQGPALVQARYDAIGRLAAQACSHDGAARTSWTDRIDAAVTHPLWGWVVFAAVMTLLFLGIFTFAQTPMAWIDAGTGRVAGWVRTLMAPGDFRNLLTDGVIAGVGAILTFLPQILVLFFFIGLLESTGYMARAAFIMDRLMNRVGLNGRSFIPLLSSYACAIPGILATRTIEQPKDRLTTILVAPLMSCSARLPVYLLMIAAMLPADRAPLIVKVGLMLLMYGLGTAGAFGFAWLFKRTLLKGAPPPMIMELPPYRLPRLGDVGKEMVHRAWHFLRQAGTVILGISILLWFLSAYPKLPAGSPPEQQVEQSFVGRIGRVIEPAIKPLGFDWRIGVGLVSSFAAREVFVSSTAVVFRVEHVDPDSAGKSAPLRTALRDARWPDGRPLFTPLVCLSLMIFYVFAMQCMSTLAVVRRETGSWRWPAFQAAYMTGTAWVLSFLVYQGGHLLGL